MLFPAESEDSSEFLSKKSDNAAGNSILGMDTFQDFLLKLKVEKR